MILENLIELNKMEKDQLIQLCNALYALLGQREAAPAFTFIPAPVNPTYVPPFIGPTWNGGTSDPLPTGGRTICKA